jgi:hypothetical protein
MNARRLVCLRLGEEARESNEGRGGAIYTPTHKTSRYCTFPWNPGSAGPVWTGSVAFRNRRLFSADGPADQRNTSSTALEIEILSRLMVRLTYEIPAQPHMTRNLMELIVSSVWVWSGSPVKY